MRINPNTTAIKPNRPVSESFLKLKHSILSCKRHDQLELLSEVVRDHARSHPHEADILVEYMNASGRLSPDIESIHHHRNCGAH